MHGVFLRRLCRPIRGVERQRRRSAKRRAHHHDGAKHVGPDQRAPGRDRRAEIMADHGIDAAVAERRHQPERIAHQIGQPERGEIAVVVRIPSGGAAIAALVRRDHVIAGRRQSRHHLAPAIGEFGKAVQQQKTGAAFGFVAGLQHMHAQAVDVVDDSGSGCAEGSGMSGREVVVFIGRAFPLSSSRESPGPITTNVRADKRLWLQLCKAINSSGYSQTGL